jgi:thioesterase domain-containing protein/acyl carrier protein
VRDQAVLTAPVTGSARPGNRVPPRAHGIDHAAAIATADGLAAFKEILAAPHPNVVVYPEDLNAFIDRLNRNQDPGANGAVALAVNVTDEVEARLLGWWRELLGVMNAGRDDDFFALGGQSLIAVRLLAKVKKHYGVELDLAVLFKAPTAAKLAQLIKGDQPAAAFRAIVPIRPTGVGAPLFLIHALGGRVIGYGDLARHLPENQIVYGVEFTLHDADPTHFRLGHLAANYLLELRRVQPHGPYHLLGFSFGGLLAYEMAQQLTNQGEEVAFLGMLDTWQTGHLRELDGPVARPRRAIDRAQRLFRNARDELAATTQLPQIVSKLRDRGVLFITDLIGLGRRRLYSILEHLHRPVPAWLQFVNDINWYAVERYQFSPYPGRITLFRASHGIGAADNRYGWDLGWGGLAKGGVEVHPVTSDHLGILREPSVRELASEITKCLIEREQNAGEPRQTAEKTIADSFDQLPASAGK